MRANSVSAFKPARLRAQLKNSIPAVAMQHVDLIYF